MSPRPTDADLARLSAKLARAVALLRRMEEERTTHTGHSHTGHSQTGHSHTGPAMPTGQNGADHAPRRPGRPIALVAMAGRFPGAPDVESLSALLDSGRDAVGPLPARDRFDAPSLLAREPGEPGRIISAEAGTLTDIDRFDSAFFGYTPREADALDPQHRLLLDTTQEVLERAALPPRSLVGARVGVYIGLSNSDYAQRRLRGPDPAAIQAYDFTGTILATAAGAISHRYGFRGPCQVVDTACSASLVAICAAVSALRAGEADLALAGGVNLILCPDMQIALSRLGALAPGGRCRTFDAAADGYVRGEGVALVALKRLDEAQRDGDPVLAVIRGAAVNHNGRSNGLFAPSGEAQQAVIRAALADAGLPPAAVACIETHGTGTRLGDPIEIDSLRAVFDSPNDETPEPGTAAQHPLILGALKSHIGHLEAAAGVAGLIALVDALRRRRVAGLLHQTVPNPLISWGQRLRPACGTTPLSPPPAWPLVGGVSSFGVSGTNAHLVVEVRDDPPPVPAADDPAGDSADNPADNPDPQLLVISAPGPGALRQTATRLARALATDPTIRLADVAHTLIAGRDLCRHRLALVATTPAEAAARLAAFAAQDDSAQPAMPPAWVTGEVASDPAADADPAAPDSAGPGVAFLFTGQGSQVAGMGRALLKREPVFRALMQRADAALREAGHDAGLIDDLLAPPSPNGPDLLADTRHAQPALFALGVALAGLWQSWGVRPRVLIGHSLGELIAACVAGVFDLEDGVRLAARRGRLMAEAPGEGGMIACLADAETLTALLTPAGLMGGETGLALAAINGPRAVTLSGPRATLARARPLLRDKGVRTADLPVSHAFHSPMMQAAATAFGADIAHLTLRPPRLPVISNLTGKAAGAALCDPAYWVAQMLAPVRFADGLRTVLRRSLALWIEVGARPALAAGARETIAAAKAAASAASATGSAPVVLPSLDPGRPDRASLLESLGAWVVRGEQPDPTGLAGTQPVRRIPLPPMALERRRHWLPDPAPAPIQTPTQAGPPESAATADPLPGARVDLPDGRVIFTARIDETQPAWAADHRVFGAVLFPGAGLLDLALRCGQAVLGDLPRLNDAVIRAPLRLDQGTPITLQTELIPHQPAPGGWRVVLSSCTVPGSWHRHAEVWLDLPPRQAPLAEPRAEGSDPARDAPSPANTSDRLHPPAGILPTPGAVLPDDQGPGLLREEPGAFYSRARALGIAYGPAFQGLGPITRTLGSGTDEADGWAWARVAPDPQWLGVPSADAPAGLHPAVLDACFQVAGAALTARDPKTAVVPVAVESLVCTTAGMTAGRVLARLRRGPGLRVRVDLDAWAEDAATDPIPAAPTLRLRGLLLEPVTQDRLRAALPDRWRDWLGQPVWVPLTPPDPPAPDTPAPGDPVARPDTPAAAPSILAAVDPIAQGVAACAALADQPAIRAAARQMPVLERFCRQQRRAVLAALGIDPATIASKATRDATPEALADRLGIVRDHRRLFAHLLTGAAATDPADDTLTDAERASLANDPTARLVTRSADHLPAVLRGRMHPLQVLFPEGSDALVRAVYAETPLFAAMQEGLGQLCAALARALPPGAGLRVLEVGAGTGSTTAQALPALGNRCADYLFTDVSRLLLERARSRFGTDHPALRTALFDAEDEPDRQGLTPASLDLILAANVVHATRDLVATLARLRRLLRPGGLLVLAEGVVPWLWADLTFGMTDGWWRFVDTDLRPHHPLVADADWPAVLARAGFVDATSLAPRDAQGVSLTGQALLVARSPAAAPVAPRPEATAAGGETASRGRLILLGGPAAVAAALAEAAREMGWQTRRLTTLSDPTPGATDAARPEDADTDTDTDTDRDRDEAGDKAGPDPLANADRILDLRPLGGDPAKAAEAPLVSPATHQGTDVLRGWPDLAPTLALLRRLAVAPRPPRDGLCLVTAGAWGDGDPTRDAPQSEASARQAALWGLIRAANREHPALAARCLDIEPSRLSALGVPSPSHAPPTGATRPAARGLLAATEPGQDLVRLTRGGAQVLRIHPAGTTPLPPPLPIGRLARGTVLITGGFGGLGLALVRHLAGRGVRRLVLVVRRPADATADAVLAAARSRGTQIDCVPGDLADPATLPRAVAEADRPDAPLMGVIHAAGVVADALLTDQSPAHLAATLAPKAEAAWRLHHALGDRRLDFLVLFSSATTLLAVASQANHGAASVALGALARHRRARGLAATVIDWGPWADSGAATRDGLGARIAAMGVGALRPADGLTLIDALMNGDQAPVHLAVLPVDWPAFRARYGADPLTEGLGTDETTGEVKQEETERGAPPPLPADIGRTSTDPPPPVPAGTGGLTPPDDWRPGLAALPPGARQEAAEARIAGLVALILGHGPESRLDPGAGLFDLGLDSLTAMELRNLLSKALATPLPASLTFSHPTIRALATLALDCLGLAPSITDAATNPAPATRPDPPAADTAHTTDATDATDATDEDALLALIDREYAALGLAADD